MFLGYRWCLSEELTALTFFDDEVPDDMKRRWSFLSAEARCEHPLKRVTLDPRTIKTQHEKDSVT